MIANLTHINKACSNKGTTFFGFIIGDGAMNVVTEQLVGHKIL